MAQVVECLPSIHDTPASFPRTTHTHKKNPIVKEGKTKIILVTKANQSYDYLDLGY
jgi:hypothetical protein